MDIRFALPFLDPARAARRGLPATLLASRDPDVRRPGDRIVQDWEASIWLDRREILPAALQRAAPPARGLAAAWAALWAALRRHAVRMQLGPVADGGETYR